METIQKPDKRLRFKCLWHLLLMLIASMIVASMTFTACDGDEPKKDDETVIPKENNDDENGENGDNNGGGGNVSEIRLKSTLITGADGEIQRGEYTYNSDGSANRTDWYDGSSKQISYDIFTNNPDGTYHQWENFNTDGDMVMVYTYDDNKKPLKAEGTIYNSLGEHPITYAYTFKNGRLTFHEERIGDPSEGSYIVVTFEPQYDNNGNKSITTETHSLLGTRLYERTYNSDGTLQKVVVEGYKGYPTTAFTQTFTWENKKTTVNFEDFAIY